MNTKISRLLISMLLAVALMAQPARPSAANTSPLETSGITRVFASPLPRSNEKQEQREPAWLLYWRWLVAR